MSDETETSARERRRERQEKGVGGGEGLSSTGQKLMTTPASTCADGFEARL